MPNWSVLLTQIIAERNKRKRHQMACDIFLDEHNFNRLRHVTPSADTVDGISDSNIHSYIFGLDENFSRLINTCFWLYILLTLINRIHFHVCLIKIVFNIHSISRLISCFALPLATATYNSVLARHPISECTESWMSLFTNFRLH